ncbi:MAG: hypothetical protein ABL984_17170, partial [Pyrinomonadaceae bacterium]
VWPDAYRPSLFRLNIDIDIFNNSFSVSLSHYCGFRGRLLSPDSGFVIFAAMEGMSKTRAFNAFSAKSAVCNFGDNA